MGSVKAKPFVANCELPQMDKPGTTVPVKQQTSIPPKDERWATGTCAPKPVLTAADKKAGAEQLSASASSWKKEHDALVGSLKSQLQAAVARFGTSADLPTKTELHALIALATDVAQQARELYNTDDAKKLRALLAQYPEGRESAALDALAG